MLNIPIMFIKFYLDIIMDLGIRNRKHKLTFHTWHPSKAEQGSSTKSLPSVRSMFPKTFPPLNIFVL
jgi:hypothetical protein